MEHTSRMLRLTLMAVRRAFFFVIRQKWHSRRVIFMKPAYMQRGDGAYACRDSDYGAQTSRATATASPRPSTAAVLRVRFARLRDRMARSR